MITFEQVVKRYPDGTVAVYDLSFEVPEGEILVLVGPSGCGKTTSMRMINRMIEPTSGLIRVDGRDVMATDPAELRRGIGYVIQQIGLFPHRSVADNIGTVPRLLGWQQDRTEERVEELVEVVGLRAELAERYPHQLSGGQRQRVAIARALAEEPDVIVLDEPMSALDVSVSAQIANLLLDLQDKFDVSYVFVAHDMHMVRHLCHRVAVLLKGDIVESGPVREVMDGPAHAYTRALIAASELRSLDPSSAEVAERVGT